MNGQKIIKVCGMRDPDNLEAVCGLSPDLVGFIFYAPSARYVGDRPDPALFGIPPASVGRVGVFVNETPEQMLRATEKYGFDFLQLHGDETPETCRMLAGQGIQVIKAIAAGNTEVDMEAYLPHVRFFLFDTPTAAYGGSGLTFDWSLLEDYRLECPFLLSGGIGPRDADRLSAFRHPRLAGIDLNSRFELEPGLKDRVALATFIQKIRNH